MEVGKYLHSKKITKNSRPTFITYIFILILSANMRLSWYLMFLVTISSISAQPATDPQTVPLIQISP